MTQTERTLPMKAKHVSTISAIASGPRARCQAVPLAELALMATGGIASGASAPFGLSEPEARSRSQRVIMESTDSPRSAAAAAMMA